MNLVDYITGELVARDFDSVVVAVGGMGLRIRTSSRTAAAAPAVGEPVRLVTYLYIREDVRTLYGFATVEEREIFTRLLTVGGVGPRSALAALSLLSGPSLLVSMRAPTPMWWRRCGGWASPGVRSPPALRPCRGTTR
jgi:Holliday junction resolvasome RuvABC DNA-binding subunit